MSCVSKIGSVVYVMYVTYELVNTSYFFAVNESNTIYLRSIDPEVHQPVTFNVRTY